MSVFTEKLEALVVLNFTELASVRLLPVMVTKVPVEPYSGVIVIRWGIIIVGRTTLAVCVA